MTRQRSRHVGGHHNRPPTTRFDAERPRWDDLFSGIAPVIATEMQIELDMGG